MKQSVDRKKKMGTLPVLFFCFSFVAHTALGGEKCLPTYCSATGQRIQFPFRLNDRPPKRCGYPGFDLSCNNRSQPVLNIPPAGDFIVKYINYESQHMYINDPDFCLPRKLISFNLFEDSPFRGDYLKNLTLINCTLSDSPLYYRAVPIRCLSGHNYTVVALDTSPYGVSVPPNCQSIANISIPANDPYGFSMDLNKDLPVRWSNPSCGGCVTKGGTCGFKNSEGLQIKCSNVPTHGLPRSAKYGIIIGAGIPGLVFVIGLVCYICSKVRAWGRRSQRNTELPTSTIIPQSAAAVVTGLDGPTIESYPKTVLGDSGRLPKPSDGTCPICLSEYQPKEVLRTIPECNHYFHAECVDEWLRMNATCPLCRNLPDGSSLMTPCSSMSLSSSSTSSSS